MGQHCSGLGKGETKELVPASEELAGSWAETEGLGAGSPV